jgi:hypothetical protein
MGKFIVLCAISFVLLSLCGCASLGKLASEIQQTDASQEIAAVSSISDDILDSPWDNITQVALGYCLALVRRWYKQKQGAK